MERPRSRAEKVAVVIALAAATWVIGSTLFYRSGGLNGAGLLPSAACLVALWGAVRSDVAIMWIGTVLALLSAAAFVFSVGLAVAPAALALALGSLLLTRSKRSTA